MAAESTRFVQMFGLEIRDAELYRRYRERMTPLLHAHGGAFGYDLVVAEVLKAPTTAPIHRVFTIHFPDRTTSERFFTDPAYRAVRAELFEPAAGAVTKIAEFEQTGLPNG